jgi:hypothetical protein
MAEKVYFLIDGSQYIISKKFLNPSHHRRVIVAFIINEISFIEFRTHTHMSVN